MTDEELCKQLRGWGMKTPSAGAARIEALTEQLEAARADAKEAEAYAEELEKQCEGLMQAGMNNGQALIIAEAKLARAVEALRAFKDFDDMPTSYKRPDVFELRVRRKLLATLAEIEGEKT
jgi:hypothetical protein